MIYGFRRSRWAAAGVMLLSIAITVALWLRPRQTVLVPLIASILMLALGAVAARLVGNILAGMENTRYLGYLHMELDPEKFLACYAPVPKRMKGQGALIAKAYLADGYWAAGDYDEAWQLLQGELPTPALRGLYCAKRAACALAMGNTQLANDALQELSGVIDGCRLERPELAANLETELTIYRQHLACLEGKPVDTAWLEDAFAAAQYNIRRLEIQKVLALAALNAGEKTAAQKALGYLRKQGGKTAFKRWADQH